MDKKHTRNLVLSGVFAALIMLATMISLQLPSGAGYVHFGDSIIFVAVLVIGNLWYSAASAAIGSALSDVLTGFAIYAPATFVIKGAMSLLLAFLLKKLGKKHELFCIFLASLVVPCGYFLFELVFFGNIAYLNIWYNLLQAIAGVVVAELLLIALRKTRLINK